MNKTLRLSLTVLLVTHAAIAQQPSGQGKSPADFYKMGHSRHGEAFDSGPRQKPWVMEGIGKTHFPITTSNEEVQKWFDQGNTLLHSFWYYEAERAFRWALKLDPECASCYWGLARAVADEERAEKLIKEAAKRKGKVSERERMYIEAWEATVATPLPKEVGGNEASYEARDRKMKSLLEQIVMKYPDDLEAKSLLALQHMGGPNRYGTEMILQQIIAREPNHPGAHHYRIHNWDGRDGAYALDSCALYGRIAPQIGHAQHMPGHINSGVGMWNEAAISMDAATRVEREYMRRRLVLPYNTWNYAHNQNYLSYIQEQLGMAEAAIYGARQVMAAPLDPKQNNPDQYGAHWQGTTALMRALMKYERWKELVAPDTFNWQEVTRDRMWKAFVEARGYIGLGELEKAARAFAAHADLKKEIDKPENRGLEQTHTIQSLEMKGLIALAKGDALAGIAFLSDAAKREFEQRERQNDPPSYPVPVYNLLGRAYLDQKSPALAAAAFEKTLELVRNDGFALSGLVEAYGAAGEKEKAREAYARLLYVWSDADPGLKWMERARAAGLEAKPKDTSPGPQRNYKRTTLDSLGPSAWEPYDAPELGALDPDGRRVSLAAYRGKNVLLIFFLGEECPHCMLQLREVAKRYKELAGLNTEVLAVSSDTPQENAEALKKGDIQFKLLSDVNFENARRYKSYDDFEDMALHSTILIDSRGRVHWAQTGGDPFMGFDFLVKEIKRLNKMTGKTTADQPAAAAPTSQN